MQAMHLLNSDTGFCRKAIALAVRKLPEPDACGAPTAMRTNAVFRIWISPIATQPCLPAAPLLTPDPTSRHLLMVNHKVTAQLNRH
jgi:hypothetical protein